MIMTVSFPIVAARAIAKGYLANQTLISQIAERVIDGGKTDSRQRLARGFENFRGRRVMVARANHIEHNSPLPRETAFTGRLGCRLWLLGHSNLELY